ncbi:MAG: collagen-like protein [Ruminiclostridium sp.]|nr:collagen-like protein [Ruminiclostridium sp.]
MNLFRIENEGLKITVNMRVQNKGLSEEYTLRQIGLFARLEGDDSDVLFAVIQDIFGEVIPEESNNSEFLTEFDFVIPVANSGKIQVEITPNTFATTEDIAKAEKELEGHISDKGNPHNVTKAQVGLGNVPNVATNDQTVTYTAAADLGELASGEKLSIAFGKLAKAVKSLIEHIGDSVKHITAAERTAWNGKAAGNHTHTAAEVSALTDIKIGTVTTGAAGSGASASTSGTVTTLNLVIPKGDTGAKGATGAQGAQGAKGDKGDKGDTGAAGAADAKGATGATGTRGSRWTVGTAVTGNSSAATVFSGTGITDALVNDMYLNSSTGYVYKCTAAGAANAAKWVYVGSIKGATGAQGAKGDKGDPGIVNVVTGTVTTSAAGTVAFQTGCTKALIIAYTTAVSAGKAAAFTVLETGISTSMSSKSGAFPFTNTTTPKYAISKGVITFSGFAGGYCVIWMA